MAAGQLGKRFLVWIVAGAASIEALLQGTIASVRRDFLEASIWVVGVVLVYGSAVVVERLKGFEVE